jgi:hypothetical protein
VGGGEVPSEEAPFPRLLAESEPPAPRSMSAFLRFWSDDGDAGGRHGRRRQGARLHRARL